MFLLTKKTNIGITFSLVKKTIGPINHSKTLFNPSFLFGVADNPKTIPASSIEDDWTIAEVIKHGLKIESLEGPDQCIDQAKVVVFKFKKGD